LRWDAEGVRWSLPNNPYPRAESQMIIDRYARPANLSEPIVSDPILQESDWILDDPYLFALVRRDMAEHYKASGKDRPPVPVEVTLRMIV
jgi:hypothetical protein